MVILDKYFDKTVETLQPSSMPGDQPIFRATTLMPLPLIPPIYRSQTIFTMRAGVFSRWNGIMIALVELTIFALPFSIVQARHTQGRGDLQRGLSSRSDHSWACMGGSGIALNV